MLVHIRQVVGIDHHHNYPQYPNCIWSVLCMTQTIILITLYFGHCPLFCFVYSTILRGPGSSVGIATDYGLDGPGSNPGGDENFPPVQSGPGAHPASCKMGTGSFPRVKCGRGLLLTTHPLLVPRSWKCRAIPLPTLWATPGL